MILLLWCSSSSYVALLDSHLHPECARIFVTIAAVTQAREDTANKTCDYAIALAHKTPAYCPREDLLALLHQFMENRTYNLAFTHLLNQVFLSEHERDGPFWILAELHKQECLRIIHKCIDAIRNRADHLLREMAVYRL